MKRNRTAPAVVALLAVAALLSTGVGAWSSSLAQMTLTKPDLPAGFDQKFSRQLPKSRVKQDQGAITNGFVGGWQRAFTRLQGVDTAAVTSSVLKYDSSTHADNAVRSSWRHVLTYTAAKRVTVGRPLGDEARAITYQTSTGVTAYAVIWRYKNINGSVLVVGLKSLGVTLDLATGLAVKQQQHIRAERG